MTESTPGTIEVSVFVQTKNEAVGIAACLRALGRFDEVVVIDSNSTDRTGEIAQALGARVVNFTWDGRYPKKKQWQLNHVRSRHNWVLFLDADERPSSALVDELASLDLASCVKAAFDVTLDYWFAGRRLRHGHRVTKRVLVHRDRVWFPEIDDLDLPGMGELEGHYQPKSLGRIGALEGRIEHEDPDPVRTWFDRHNRYSDWEAEVRSRPSARASIAGARSSQGRIFDLAPGKPVVFFLYSYVIRCGFLDGQAGLDYAFALAHYYWQIGVKYREVQRSRLARESVR